MKKENRAVKVPIYPDEKQAALIEKTFGCARFIFAPQEDPIL